MFHPALPDFFIVAMVFAAAGAVKGVLGLGLPTVAIGLLGLFMPVGAAAALLTVPSLVTNVWQAFQGSQFLQLLRRLWTMQVGVVVGVAIVALAFPHVADAWGRTLLGACLVAYGVLGLFGRPPRRMPERWQRPVGIAAGLASGVMTGFTGVFVLPAVPYLQSLQLGKDGMAQALGICFTLSTAALAAGLWWQGHLDLRASGGSLAMVVPALAGMWLGQSLRDAMSEAVFRRCFFAGLALLGAWMLAR